MGYRAKNISQEFIQGTDHRAVCITKNNKIEFKQTPVKSIRFGIGCPIIFTGKSESEKTT